MSLALTLFGMTFSGREAAVVGVVIVVVVAVLAWAYFRRVRPR